MELCYVSLVKDFIYLKKKLCSMLSAHTVTTFSHTLCFVCVAAPKSQLGKARRSTRLLRQSGDTVLFIHGIDRP